MPKAGLWRQAIALILGLGFMIVGCSGSDEGETEPVVTVDVAPVLSSSIQKKVVADSVLYPLSQAAIVPKVSAPVKQFYVNRGDRVRAGQLLAELENRDLAGAVAESQAALAQAEAAYQTAVRATVPEASQKAELDLRAAKDALDAQQRLYDSRASLFKEGAIAQKDVNEAQVALVQARNQAEIAEQHLQNLQGFAKDQALKSAEAERDAAKGRYESVQAQLSYSKITSPIDGIVTDRPNYAGEMPASGSALITVMDVSEIVARVHVSPSEAALVKVGSEASLMPPGRAPIAGKVTQVSPALDSTGTTVEVWVQAPNADGALKPGTGMRVEIVAETAANTLIIPERAILTSSSGATSVIVVDADNKPHKVAVSVGIQDDGMHIVQVTDGLESGQRVVTSGAFELGKLDPEVIEKTKVQIQAPKEEEEEDDAK